MSVAVVTPVFGGYDLVRPAPAQTVDVDWVAVTDDPGLEVPAPWRRRVTDALHPRNPRMDAVRVRTSPTEWAPDARWVVSIDANMRIDSPSFAADMVAAAPSGLGAFAHPRRDCLYAEAEMSAVEAPRKWGPVDLAAQADAYRHEGHPERWGLWAGGVIVADTTDDTVLAVLADWYRECLAHRSAQSQVSFPVACRRHGIRPDTIPTGRRLGSPWLTIQTHIGRT
mgnify:CR=1 FL=1